MTEYTIRSARGAADFETVSELQRQCLPSDAAAPYRHGSQWWLVRAEDGTPVAFAGVNHIAGKMSYLCRAGVLPAARGSGLQKRLIRVRVAAARRRGSVAVITDTTRANIASSNSLIACGFRTYWPETRWALSSSVYWLRSLAP
jgi:GNAT superfamily N-acetyltransferase